MSKVRKKPHRSLRTNLIIWFLLTSIAPLAFLTGYSIVKFERAIDDELFKRLEGNAREITTIFSDFHTTLKQRRDRAAADPYLIYHLSIDNPRGLEGTAVKILKADIASTISLFNRNGRLLNSVFRDGKGEIRQMVLPANGAVYLSDANLAGLADKNEQAFIEHFAQKKISLILLSKLINSQKKVVGYIEQAIELDRSFLDGLKNRLKLELFLLNKNAEVTVASHTDFFAYAKTHFAKFTQEGSSPFFELSLRGEPFGFLTYPMEWGPTKFYLGLGASKAPAKAVLQNVKYTFFSVVGAVIVFLIGLIILISNAVLSPLEDLVAATQKLKDAERPLEIPIKSDTEIGLLTESFNEMSANVVKARSELKNKITELENINTELKDTQSQLVHSSKMISLGQLVAGVAHELNNPIGFIYSNMTQLRDYANKLIELGEVAQTSPGSVKELSKKLDLDYIKQDLPKLVASCEEGARRTRDIVLGLRNFSRLDEAKLKDINLHEAIDETLNLLAGEIKNRIQIHRYYGDLPVVTCFASQLNQVFMNILSNAVQAIENEGNIWITTKVVQNEGKDFASISVQDSGHGMDAATLDKIFDPFFSTKDVGKGTGLGLSISYGIVQKHGGKIMVKSQKGSGTEFVVMIPVKHSAADLLA